MIVLKIISVNDDFVMYETIYHSIDVTTDLNKYD
jgi:hypothetical protein